jgi:hypothetical protein
MGMESFGRNEEEQKSLQDVELTPEERSLDSAREAMLAKLVEKTGFSPDRVVSILSSMKRKEVQARRDRDSRVERPPKQVYTFTDKNRSVELGLTYEKEGLSEVSVSIDGVVIVDAEKSGALIKQYMLFAEAPREFMRLTKDAPEAMTEAVDDLLAP